MLNNVSNSIIALCSPFTCLWIVLAYTNVFYRIIIWPIILYIYLLWRLIDISFYDYKSFLFHPLHVCPGNLSAIIFSSLWTSSISNVLICFCWLIVLWIHACKTCLPLSVSCWHYFFSIMNIRKYASGIIAYVMQSS